jgi:hypothetical protein
VVTLLAAVLCVLPMGRIGPIRLHERHLNLKRASRSRHVWRSYRKSAERLRYELSERGKVVRRRRDESYISVAVWKTAAPYRVHVRREEGGMWGYRLERVDAPGSSSTGKGRRRRRTK